MHLLGWCLLFHRMSFFRTQAQGENVSSLIAFAKLIDQSDTVTQIQLLTDWIRTCLQWGADPDRESYQWVWPLIAILVITEGHITALLGDCDSRVTWLCHWYNRALGIVCSSCQMRTQLPKQKSYGRIEQTTPQWYACRLAERPSAFSLLSLSFTWFLPVWTLDEFGIAFYDRMPFLLSILLLH